MGMTPGPMVSSTLRVVSETLWRWGIIVAAVLVAGWVFFELRLVTIPAFVALLIATVLHPLVSWLRNRGWPSLLATWTVLIAVILVTAGIIALLVPAFLDQTEDLGTQIDEGIAEIENWLETGPLGIENPDIAGALESAVERLQDAGPAIFEGVSLVVEIITGAVLAVVMAFFFLKDGPKIVDWALGHVPGVHRRRIADAGAAAWATLAGFVRATLVVGIVNGVAIGAGMLILGVPLAMPVALITAIGAFFPLVGAVVAGALAALVALVSGGVVDALIIVGITVGVQQLEGDVLSPVLLGRALSLHPLVVLAVLTVGAVVAGILGAFIAVPFAAMSVAAGSSLRRSRATVAVGTGDP